jgi:hypothetical protein
MSPSCEPTLEEWERRVEIDIQDNRTIPETERQALIVARRGQGQFRANVLAIERACRVTKVERPEHLIASHTKPWRDSSNEERLDGENGFLLTLVRMGITPERKLNVGGFSEGQRKFLEYHRDSVLRMSSLRR